MKTALDRPSWLELWQCDCISFRIIPHPERPRRSTHKFRRYEVDSKLTGKRINLGEPLSPDIVEMIKVGFDIYYGDGDVLFSPELVQLISFRVFILLNSAFPEAEGTVGVLTMSINDFNRLHETTNGVEPERLCKLSEHGLDIHYDREKGFRLGGSRKLGMSEEEVASSTKSALRIDLTQAMYDKKPRREILSILDESIFGKKGMAEVCAQLAMAETLPTP